MRCTVDILGVYPTALHEMTRLIRKACHRFSDKSFLFVAHVYLPDPKETDARAAGRAER